MVALEGVVAAREGGGEDAEHQERLRLRLRHRESQVMSVTSCVTGTGYEPFEREESRCHSESVPSGYECYVLRPTEISGLGTRWSHWLGIGAIGLVD